MENQQKFVHLHIHTQYSLLDGAIKIPDLIEKGVKEGFPALAITDHGNMFGVLEFYKEAKKREIKPIIGSEFYLAPKSYKDRSQRVAFHLILLARNFKGYQNLMALSSRAYLEGFYYHPRIDKYLLGEHKDGLIALSGCLASEISRAIIDNNINQAKKTASEFKEIFDSNCFFLELMDNGLKEQKIVNEHLIKIGKELDIPLVCTNDVHYLKKEDSRAHEVLLCIQTGKSLEDNQRMRHETEQYYLKTLDEMKEIFSHVPEAIENTISIAEMCDVELKFEGSILPQYPIPSEYTAEEYLNKLAKEGLEKRLCEIGFHKREVYERRLLTELEMISKMGYAGYFLIVWDFVNYARRNNIPVGPGRGSGAGSLVAYSLKITDIDPIQYGLLFERFLNPERASLPDFDIDFCQERRNEILKYIQEKYGQANVALIATFAKLKARQAIRDAGRVLGMPYGEVDTLARIIPLNSDITIQKAILQEPKIESLIKQEPKYKELLDIASLLEGLNRNVSVHAAGIVISDRPLWGVVPLFKGSQNEIVTQFDKDIIEETGLIKFDLLGLKTLTLIHTTLNLIKRRHKILGKPLNFDLSRIPIDDRRTFELLQRGETQGVFQLESEGFKNLLMRLKPDRFEDLIAAVALHRPGPLAGGVLDDFIQRKHKAIKITYLHPLLEDILKETYGVIVYQEQVMQIASKLAGFTLAQADLLRRAMGKKKPEEMIKQKSTFIKGAVARGINEKKAEEIFQLMAYFAGYGFNKSHSTAYAMIAYQSAYLKAHWPEEFMTALLTHDKQNTSKIVKYIADSKSMGIEILPPDINESEADFTVIYPKEKNQKPKIRFGLEAVKGVGKAGIEAILKERKTAPFQDFFDFCSRIDLRKVNRKLIEALIKSGAFDSINRRLSLNRNQIFSIIDSTIEKAKKFQNEQRNPQQSLFSLFEQPKSQISYGVEYPKLPEWDKKTLLQFERESLGFYITGHPLDRYKQELKRANCLTTANISRQKEESLVSVAGMVEEYKDKPAQKGRSRKISFILEDSSGKVPVVAFGKIAEKYEQILKSNEPLLIEGRIRFRVEEEQSDPEIIMERAIPLHELRAQTISSFELKLNLNELSPDHLHALKDLLLRYPGKCKLQIYLEIPEKYSLTFKLGDEFSVKPSEQFFLELERLFGTQAINRI
jgi:DNA polymerase-3 subunit alpha